MHIKVFTPTFELFCKIVNKMCLHATQVFDCQTGKEYGFGKFCLSNSPGATELNLLTYDELAELPNNNLEYERHLAGFGKRAAVEKFRNQRFTAKGISGSFQSKTGKGFNKVVKFLKMDQSWLAGQ